MSNEVIGNYRVAVIAGTGFETAFSDDSEQITIQTPFGATVVLISSAGEGRLVFVARHGGSHTVPPHKINSHAQIWALRAIGITSIIATAATGSLRVDRVPGDIILLDDFIDARGVVTTFFDGDETGVTHTDFSTPFGGKERSVLLACVQEINTNRSSPQNVYGHGTYVCVTGPRYETPAEVRLFGSWGADVVGMTVAPEAILARELGIGYAALAVVTNLGTGLSKDILKHEDVSAIMAGSHSFLKELVLCAAKRLVSRIPT